MERLERIKTVVENNKQYSKKEMLLIRNDDIDWLIEQAERAEKMEMMYENTGSIMNRRHQIDKIERYETALKFGIKYLQNSDSRQIQLVKNALKEALGDNA